MAAKERVKVCGVQVTLDAKKKLLAVCKANGYAVMFRQLSALIEDEHTRLVVHGTIAK